MQRWCKGQKCQKIQPRLWEQKLSLVLSLPVNLDMGCILFTPLSFLNSFSICPFSPPWAAHIGSTIACFRKLPSSLSSDPAKLRLKTHARWPHHRKWIDCDKLTTKLLHGDIPFHVSILKNPLILRSCSLNASCPYTPLPCPQKWWKDP